MCPVSLVYVETVPTDSDGPTALGLPSRLVVVDMVWPEQSNNHGTLFGGAALSMLDPLAYIMGSQALRGTVVTAPSGGWTLPLWYPPGMWLPAKPA